MWVDVSVEPSFFCLEKCFTSKWSKSQLTVAHSSNEILINLLQANGELYYFSSLIAFGIVIYVNPQLCVSVYDNFGPIIGTLNIFALALCLYLLIKAKMKQHEDDPYIANNVRSKTITGTYLNQLPTKVISFHRNSQFYMSFIVEWKYIPQFSESKRNK